MGTTVTKQGEWGNIVNFETLVVGDAFYNLGYPETVYLKTTCIDGGFNAMYHLLDSEDRWLATILRPDLKVVGLDSNLIVKGPPPSGGEERTMIDDGGPAFPRAGDTCPGPHKSGQFQKWLCQEGLSRRDWFATWAPLVPDWFHSGAIGTMEGSFSWRWHYADRMIAESKRTEERQQ